MHHFTVRRTIQIKHIIWFRAYLKNVMVTNPNLSYTAKDYSYFSIRATKAVGEEHLLCSITIPRTSPMSNFDSCEPSVESDPLVCALRLNTSFEHTRLRTFHASGWCKSIALVTFTMLNRTKTLPDEQTCLCQWKTGDTQRRLVDSSCISRLPWRFEGPAPTH